MFEKCYLLTINGIILIIIGYFDFPLLFDTHHSLFNWAFLLHELSKYPNKQLIWSYEFEKLL